jgi:hypothetical protein
MKLIPLLLLLVAFLAAPLQAEEAPYRHVVLFKFKDDAPAEKVKEVEKAFAALPSRIDVIQDLEWGPNISPEGINDGYTHCFLVTFKDKEALLAYIPHPAHKEFVEQLRPILDKVMVVDFQMGKKKAEKK